MGLYETSKKVRTILGITASTSSSTSSTSSTSSVSTSISGVLKAVAGVITAAIPGIDYVVPGTISCDDILDGDDTHLVSSSDLINLRANTGDETNQSIKSKLGLATESLDGYIAAADYLEFKNKVSKKQSIAYAICLRR